MSKMIATVEALDDGYWKTIELFSGEEEEISEKAKELMDLWLSKGWPKDEIRISKSKFRTFDKRWHDEN